MKLIKNIQKKLVEFCASIYQFPVEAILCLFAFVLIVAMAEMDHRRWLDDGYFFKRFAPVSLLYVAAVFSVAFSIRVGWGLRSQQRWSKVAYWLSGLLVIVPQFFFGLEDFGHHYWFDEFSLFGVYMLAVLLLFIARGNKDNHLFVSDAIKIVSSALVAALLTGAIVMAYYAISASVFYLFLNDFFSEKFLVCRVMFFYVGVFLFVVFAPLLFCYCAKVLANKETATMPKVFDVAISKILTPALVCYALVLFLYAAKIVSIWSLPRGGVAWMVVAYLVLAFLVYMLQPFLSKTRFSFFFKYFPFISVVPLVLFWVGVVRRIGDYGLTEDRIFLLAFGVLTTLFLAFSLSKRLNCYLLMAGLAAVSIFFLTLVPPTSAHTLAIANQQHRVKDFLAKYPIYDDSTKSFVPEVEIPAECLADTVGRRQFVSSLLYLNSKDAAPINPYGVPNVIRDSYKINVLNKFVDFTSSGNTPVTGYSFVYNCKVKGGWFEVNGKTVLKYNEDDFLKENRSVLTKACNKNEQLPDELFCMKNDSVMVILNSITCVYDSGKDSVERVDFEDVGVVLSKKTIIPNSGKSGVEN